MSPIDRFERGIMLGMVIAGFIGLFFFHHRDAGIMLVVGWLLLSTRGAFKDERD